MRKQVANQRAKISWDKLSLIASFKLHRVEFRVWVRVRVNSTSRYRRVT